MGCGPGERRQHPPTLPWHRELLESGPEVLLPSARLLQGRRGAVRDTNGQGHGAGGTETLSGQGSTRYSLQLSWTRGAAVPLAPSPSQALLSSVLFHIPPWKATAPRLRLEFWDPQQVPHLLWALFKGLTLH